MQRVFPLILVLVLAITAGLFSLKKQQPRPPAPSAATAKTIPAAGEPVKSEKTDAARQKASPRPWAQASSDIPADSAAVFGSLPNGLRYVIYPNTEPPKRLSLRLHIAAGSLMEAEDQRGLAHFLEHMVFNGTKHYSAADLIPKMQRLGIAFGAHANAYTSFDETVYMLALPDLADDTLDLGFTVMRDFGDGALLAPEEIDKERGVILSEKTSRDSVQFRILEQQFAALLPGSLVAKRFPIGEENVISHATRDRFVDLYTRYYTPERMTFVIAGDVDPAAMKARIEATFGSMTNPENPGTDPNLGPLKIAEGIEPHVFADKEVSSSDVSLMLVRKFAKEPDTQQTRAEKLALAIAHSVMERRFDRISKEKNSPVAEASVSRSDLFDYAELGSIDITAADDRWKEVVPVLEQEFRRAMEFGFTDEEIAEAKANLLNDYEQAVKQKPTRKSEHIANAIVKSVNNKKVFSSPETNLEIVRNALDALDAHSCHDALKKFWHESGYHLVLTTKEKTDGADRELSAIFEESRGKEVTPPAAEAVVPFGYESFGEPGTVKETHEIPGLGITQFIFSNNVRVNWKRTDFEQNKIRLSARIGTGQLSQPKGMPMFDKFVTALLEGGGLGKHSNDDLQRILAGRNVTSSFGVDEDAFLLGGTTTPADFNLQCRLLCASITDPGWREEALWQFQKAVPMLMQQLRHTFTGPQLEMSSWLHGGDSRYATATEKQLSSYTIPQAKQWLIPQLAKGYLELSIVGDFDPEKILPDLLATFGALPPRELTKPDFAAARKVSFPNVPANKIFTYESKIPQGAAITLWKTDGLRNNQKEVRRVNILADILGDRMREEIREKLGASYSPHAGFDGSDALEDFGMVAAQSIGKPEDLPRLLETMRTEATTLVRDGATADELDRALKPILGQLKKSLRDNSYWLGTVLAQSQAEPEKLELARTRDEDYASITLEEINTLAKKYLSAERAILVTIKPKE